MSSTREKWEKTKESLVHGWYFPDYEDRFKRFKTMANDRPIAIILPGPSLNALEARIEELADFNILFSAINFYWIPEDFLNRINKRIEALFLCSAREFLSSTREVLTFLERKEENILFAEKTTFQYYSDKAIDELLTIHFKKMFFVGLGENAEDPVPSLEKPYHIPWNTNSLTGMIHLAQMATTKPILLFGADGGKDVNGAIYFQQPRVLGRKVLHPSPFINRDLNIFNARVPEMMKRTQETFGLNPTVLNVSPLSHYTPFERISFDQMLTVLKDEQEKAKAPKIDLIAPNLKTNPISQLLC